MKGMYDGDAPFLENEPLPVGAQPPPDLAKLAQLSLEVGDGIFETRLPVLRSVRDEYQEAMLRLASQSQKGTKHLNILLELSQNGPAVRDAYAAWAPFKCGVVTEVGRAAWALALALSAYESRLTDAIGDWEVLPDPPSPNNHLQQSLEESAPGSVDQAETVVDAYLEAHEAHLLDYSAKEALSSMHECLKSAMDSLAAQVQAFVGSPGGGQYGTPKDFGMKNSIPQSDAVQPDSSTSEHSRDFRALDHTLDQLESGGVRDAFSPLTIPLNATCRTLTAVRSKGPYEVLADGAEHLEELLSAIERGDNDYQSLVDLITELPWTLDSINTSLVEWSAEPEYPWRSFTRLVRSMSRLCGKAIECTEMAVDVRDAETFTTLRENFTVLGLKLTQTLAAMKVRIGTSRTPRRQSAAAGITDVPPDDQGSSSHVVDPSQDAPGTAAGSPSDQAAERALPEPPSVDALRRWLALDYPDTFRTLEPSSNNAGGSIAEFLPKISTTLGSFVEQVSTELAKALAGLNEARDALSVSIESGTDVSAGALRAEQSLLGLMDSIKEHLSAALESMTRHADRIMSDHLRTDSGQLRRPDGMLLVTQFLLRRFLDIASEMQHLILLSQANPWEIDLGSHFDSIRDGSVALTEQLQRYETVLRPTDERMDAIWEANRAAILDALRRVRHGQQISPVSVAASTGKYPFTIIGEHSASWRLNCDWTGELVVSKAKTHPKIRGVFRKVPFVGRWMSLGHVTLQNPTSKEWALNICAQIQHHTDVRAMCA